MDVNKCRIDDSTEYWDFRLVGVSFRSSDGKSRQSALRRAAKKQDDFENPGFVFVDLERYEYEGAPAYHVYFDDREVGSVPAALAAEIAAMEDDGYVVSGERCEIYGGPTDYCEDRSYGARVYISLERPSAGTSSAPAQDVSPPSPSTEPSNLGNHEPRRQKFRPSLIVAALLILFFIGKGIHSAIELYWSTKDGTILNANTDEGRRIAQQFPAHSDTNDSAPASAAPKEPSAERERVIPDDIPAPVSYSGYGDDVLSIDTPDYPFAFYITGNRDCRHFSVTTYSSSGAYGELLVNTTEKYSGFTIDPSFDVSTIEVAANGSWEIQIRSIYDTGSIAEGVHFSSADDAVLFVRSCGSTAYISGNGGADYFGVWTYGLTSDELLVNTTDVYSGTVMLKGDPIVLVIKAVGAWEVDF